MPGLVRVEDISRDRFAGIVPLRGSDECTERRRRLELIVAAELLRATPRFWSGAAVVVTWHDDVGDVLVLSRDPIPSWATPTNRLAGALDALCDCIAEEEAVPLERLILGVAWVSPRTWVHEARYEFGPPHWNGT